MPADLQPLGHAIKRAQYRHHRAVDAALIEIGTTLAQWDALRAIARNPESSSHKLAGLTFQSDQSFGALAGRMVERGLIQRVAGEGRALLHHLTPEGEEMLAAGSTVVDRLLAASFAPLNKAERQQLRALLSKLLGDDAP
ncbi:MarR family winged helix-turn-helix transcriptional regulator [Scleromatobacter humisilvae]|uniref:MarR family winged helix-turn-helix transcriptional regulator n=1 Tax=Scleromatobacter humisilvae TaxID=2897159 RepID=A0A9X1YMC4_9BURK|nr:MarR family winged helix-turn-helix transcriptional regulator [Scleromatobacter humisilvae]MCK9687037.1 MarR family winged helix-turn-helix transcriptional regulator [Scleromatobacter humisilvae]